MKNKEPSSRTGRKSTLQRDESWNNKKGELSQKLRMNSLLQAWCVSPKESVQHFNPTYYFLFLFFLMFPLLEKLRICRYLRFRIILIMLGTFALSMRKPRIWFWNLFNCPSCNCFLPRLHFQMIAINCIRIMVHCNNTSNVWTAAFELNFQRFGMLVLVASSVDWEG